MRELSKKIQLSILDEINKANPSGVEGLECMFEAVLSIMINVATVLGEDPKEMTKDLLNQSINTINDLEI